MNAAGTDAAAVGLAAASLLLLGAGATRAGAVAGGLALTVLAVGAVLRARRLNREMDELRRQMSARDGLAAIGLASAGFAHELKNALMVIQGFAALARKSAESTGSPRVATQVGEVEAQANRTVDRLRGFLRLVREASGAGEEQQPRPLREVVEEVAGLVGPLARERGLAFELRLGDDGLDRTVRDPAMRAALLNLGLNAVEHARASVVLEAHTGTGIDLFVTDDGPGVPAEIAAVLFQPFARGRVGGTGLGLAHVRTAVEAEGGTVRHDPTWTDGARFVVHLP